LTASIGDCTLLLGVVGVGGRFSATSTSVLFLVHGEVLDSGDCSVALGSGEPVADVSSSDLGEKED